MKLKTYNQGNLPRNLKSKSTLYINSKAGLFHLNKTAAQKMGIVHGDFIEFHQDESNPSDWYLSKSKDGFYVKNKVKGSDEKGLTFNNTSLAKVIFEAMEYTKQTGACLIGAEAVVMQKVEYWPLITAHLFKN